MPALGLLRRLRSSGGDERSFGAAAEKLRRQGQPEQAARVCRDGLERFPDQLSARVTLGWALVDLQRYEEARPEFEYVLRRAPDNLQAIRGMAHLHDHVETSDLMSLEQMSDWPPRTEDIARAVADTRTAAPTEPTLTGEVKEPSLRVPEPAAVAIVESTEGLLEEAEVLDALAAEAEAEAEVAADEPVSLDPATGVSLDAIATELVADPEPQPPEPVLLSDEPGDVNASPVGGDRRALEALQDLLERAQTRRDQVSGDSAA